MAIVASIKRITHLVGYSFRETAVALDAFGLRMAGNNVADFNFCRQRNMMPLYDKKPEAAASVFVDSSADVIGDVTLAQGASVWPGVVIRGDAAAVSIGENSNVQDDTVINSWGSKNESPVTVGNNVTIGHGAIIGGGCSIADEAFIGMNSVIGSDVVIEKHAMTAAGAVIPDGATVPSLSLIHI
eukprot:TRINITY_DN14183_c0_g1_i5.p1 TRINITY_DN14183_c0_g1~~TRINITY_DN14183_c0_g1_i5.p1  ORF type:complete len:185 (-),score=43.62 TRINITY_DN14183_c0_g1_i5:148-702(-)